MKKRGKKVGVILGAIFLLSICMLGKQVGTRMYKEQEIERYAKANGISISEYPEELIKLYERNPDTKDFVLGYPKNKKVKQKIDLSAYKHCKTVPLLMQWDQSWGYTKYAGNLMGLSGCGPTCLSMVLLYIKGEVDMNPKAVAEYATKHGYALDGTGTQWSLFTEGAKKLGLDVTELSLDEDRIVKNLEVGNPIICTMGPGDFTTTGHFIVLTGYTNGKIKINDPNSYKNSKKLWKYDDIAGQIKNLWVYR